MEETSSSSSNNTYANSNTSPPPSETNDSFSNSTTTLVRFLQAPLSGLLSDYSPIFTGPRSNTNTTDHETRPDNSYSSPFTSSTSSNNGEVSIQLEETNDRELGQSSDYTVSGSSSNGDGDLSSTSSSYQHEYDLEGAARWIEQNVPFCLLLLVVFIRQHLQALFVTIYITAFMIKSNDILQKQTALKGERKMFVLLGYFMAFMLHVIGVYWWYWNDDLFYPVLMVSPKEIPSFWHAILTILVNDTMVRQAAMAFKLVLLMYYKNGRGNNFRRQGQTLTLVEYTLLLYRALLPTPVWFQFFLNKDYGNLFSSLATGLYLTFKLTSVVEKSRRFFSALTALSRKEMEYGAYATPEQVNEGDLCAICQEKMQVPVLLCCKHIFCEDCATDWFEREKTCPLCRALIQRADLRSFGDGSTSLFVQLF